MADPARFLKDVGALLSNLAGYNEVDTPFTGLGKKTQMIQVLATCRAAKHNTHQGGTLVMLFLCGARDQTHGLMHVRQVLFH